MVAGAVTDPLRSDAVRTPDERFANLPEYPWAPKYVMVNNLRMHYVEAGPTTGEVVLLLHGEPSWSYLYRKMIPVLANAGFHVYAPDLVGFGRSDKLKLQSAYTVQMHVNQIEGFLNALGLRNMIFFGQDWGSIIGLRVVGLHPDWFSRIAIGNGTLPNPPSYVPSRMRVTKTYGDSTNPYYSAPYSPLYDPQPNMTLPLYPTWSSWLNYAPNVNPLYASVAVEQFTMLALSPGILAAYDAPFPDESYKAGARKFPLLAGTEKSKNQKAWSALRKYTKPFLTAYGDHDPILGSDGILFRSLVPGAKGQPHTTIVDSAHMLQEDKGEELAQVLVNWRRSN